MQRQNAFGLEVIVNGRALPVIQHQGKNYIAAPWDKDFQLRFNVPFGGDRYLAVTSVDGLDIMTGKTASTEAGGYVLTAALRPTDNDIPGFRLNNREVAAFHFGDRRDSYAAQLDKPANVGVIAVVFYEERPRFRRNMLSVSTRGGCLGGGQTKGGLEGHATRGGVGHDMGTEFGQRTEHKVDTTTFDRGREVARFVFEYASRENLIKAGIISSAPLGDVNPFPGDADTGCKPPKGWRG